MKALTIYKASAGSGKTFTLATEYIKLLVKNPTDYRTILAVTFTNKATEEMKMRILSQLYGIWKQLPDSSDYMQRIVQYTGFSEPQVSKRAGEALHLLLHNYNYFNVETIDTFFQSVLRNLARELDLTANLRIGLNDTQVEEQAVDQLIDSLTHTDVMLQWLMKYIMETISDDRSWNIIGQVKQFGRTIFRDFYKEHSTEVNRLLHEKGFLEGYTSQLKQIRSNAEKHMKEVAEQFFDVLQREGLAVEDLTYGRSGIAGFFLKLRSGQMDESIVGKRVIDCEDDAGKWYSKKHPRSEAIHAIAEQSLIPLLQTALEERPRQWRLYKSADLTLRHLNQLRLLGSIEQKVHELNEEANRFLLSDTQQLLHALIKDTDSPFIFEKIGTRLEHVMIDEFQDTSTVQWKNFKVLLQECMSHRNSENLIVGDVKQSIYRWRSGDWRLLNNIEREFSHANEVMEILPLDTNYRSERNIILFNNAFFAEAARLEYDRLQTDYSQGADQLKHAYADVVQKTPSNRPDSGLVSIRLLPKRDYQERVLSELADTIRKLIDNGTHPRHIAILVRTNSHISMVADYFNLHLPDIHIVSDEAFRLSASVSVNLLIQSLHLLAHPDDTLAKATIAKLYQRFVLNSQAPEGTLLIRNQTLDALLPEAYIKHFDELLQLPLYELTEQLYRIFGLQCLHGQSAYICTFFDQLSQFAQQNTTDIDTFIREWEETLSSKTIQSAETEGIRILSIHKSKGLEFDNVIIPFCDWKLEHSDTLWCHPKESPFNALPIAPIDYSEKQMRGTIYETDYLEEHLQNTVDNLNLLYVAFTRASKNLFVIGQREANGTRSALIETVLSTIPLDNVQLEGMEDNEADICFSYGTLANSSHKSRKTSNVFLQPVTPHSADIEFFDSKTEFRQSNKSRDFIEGEDEQPNTVSYIKTGSVLHEIFSTIRTTADIDKALMRLQNEGILYDNEISREKITSLLRKRLENKTVKHWFSNHWTLFNECTILHPDGNGGIKEHRPDRVMTDGHETHVVDFKFGHPLPEHQEQVRLYMSLLQQMGLPNIKGWLWYVYSNKIEEVK